MELLIIKGSPHAQKKSNTDKIVKAFCQGFDGEDCTFTYYALSDKSQWEAARSAYAQSDNILIATCMYVDCLPASLLEFLSSLPKKDGKATLSFLIQCGFTEGKQLEVAIQYAEQLPERLGCKSGGVLARGNSNSNLKAYTRMGRIFAKDGNFHNGKCRKFTGAYKLPWLVQRICAFIFKTSLKRQFENEARKRGCKEPLDARPY